MVELVAVEGDRRVLLMFWRVEACKLMSPFSVFLFLIIYESISGVIGLSLYSVFGAFRRELKVLKVVNRKI